MKYYEASIFTDSPDEIAARLIMIDITSVRIEDPRVMEEIVDSQNEYDWDYIDPKAMCTENGSPRVICYFEDEKSCEELRESFPDLEIDIRECDDSEWKDKYKETFKTLELTDSIIIRPSWEDEVETDKHVIDLDPGMAFGTGDHETTSMCAVLLEKEGCEGKTVLDVGTGSGILSIAAAVLGAKDVLGVDIDPVACEVAQENIEKNGCENTVTIKEADLTKGIDIKADIVVANIVAELIVVLSADVIRHMNKGGYFISSGILTEKEGIVLEALEKAGFTVEDVTRKGEWSAIGARYE